MIFEKILFVDDDPAILSAYQRRFRKALKVETALGGEEGLEILEEDGPFSIVVSDYNMPEMDGIEFLARVKEFFPDTIRMMLTGNADLSIAAKAVNEGSIFRFLIKPCPPETMGKALVEALEQYRLRRAEREILEKTLRGSIAVLTDILSVVKGIAFGRGVLLQKYSRLVLSKLGIAPDWESDLAATLSPIGYVAVPSELIRKRFTENTPLTEQEEAILASAPQIGADLLKKIPRLEEVTKVVRLQDKRFDGSGFPENGESREDLPVVSRILKVLNDMLDLEAGGASREESLAIMAGRRSWYDPRILHAVRETIPESTHSQEADSVTLDLAIKDLRVYDQLLSDLDTMDDRRLLTAGQVVTPASMERIKNYDKMSGIKEPIRVLRKRTSANVP